MFEPIEVPAYDAVACAERLVSSVVERRMAAASRMAWVARWAELHEPESMTRRNGSPLPARVTAAWKVETDGIPLVTSDGVLELAVLLQVSPRSAECLVRDVLELVHRLPRTWHAIMTGDVEDWQGRQLAKATRHLKAEQAQWVDREIGDVLQTLPFGRATAVVEAKVIAADPALHSERLEADDAKQFVSTRRRSNVHGLRTMVARGRAGDIARLEAMISLLADQMLAAGDLADGDTRRAKALVLLANPAMACVFLAGMDTSGPQPADTLESEETASPSAAELAREFGRILREMGGVEKLRPRSVLYLHISQAAVEGVRAAQVARVEDPVAAGPISIEQLREWLKNDRITVRPVIDPLESAPVDCYEIPARLHEAQALLTPFEVFPYGTCSARQADDDHTIAYVPMDKGGPPGQTAIGNLGPLGRSRHLAKTFGGFRVHQPLPGLYYWRTPTGWWYQVDHRGTQPLGRDRPAILDEPLSNVDVRSCSAMEQALRREIIVELAA